jgi:hypothetical protein
VTDLAAQGDPNFEVTIAWRCHQQPRSAFAALSLPEGKIAWRCHQQPRSAFAALSLPEGKTITEKVLASFPSCPIPEIARLGRTLRAWNPTWATLTSSRR